VTQPDERRLEIAAFRRHVIADAVECDGEGLTALVSALAAREWVDPTGRTVTVTQRTLWRWLAAYKRGRLLALCPAERKDRGALRAFSEELLEGACVLRREKPSRATKSVIDILVRKKHAARGTIARATLDRHLARAGLSRRALGQLGSQEVFRMIETHAPFELLVGDFHHGPWVRTGKNEAKRALLFLFIDHFSRYVPEGRYFLHEDFAALRFSFRRLITVFGLCLRTYFDNGPAFQATRFAVACSILGIELVHSKPYKSERRGVVERFNKTVKEQFESELKDRDPLLTLDELNAFFEAWLAERYHRDVHSETGEAPADRFHRTATLRPAPDPALLDELLRLRQRRTVHRKWSTVEVDGRRFRVDPSLRGRRVDVLYDPFDPSYVLVAVNGKVVERALPHKAGEIPPQPPPLATRGVPLDTVKAAFLLATARRTFRSQAAIPLGPIRSLAYYLPVLDEILALAPDPGYLAYLHRKLAGRQDSHSP
jgi:putative transposase